MGLVISHWLSTRFAVEFLGIWEQINNTNLNLTEFSKIRFESGGNGAKLLNIFFDYFRFFTFIVLKV